MADRDHIRNPVEWSVDQLKTAGHALGETGHALTRHDAPSSAPLPAVRRIEVADLKEVLAKGIADFAAYRTDVIFLCVIYPLVGLLLALFLFNHDFVRSFPPCLRLPRFLVQSPQSASTK